MKHSTTFTSGKLMLERTCIPQLPEQAVLALGPSVQPTPHAGGRNIFFLLIPFPSPQLDR